jgi:ribokinase
MCAAVDKIMLLMPSPDQPRLCVLGSINMDLVVRTPRLPVAGETVMGGPLSKFPGGKGANQAVAAARMGAAVSFVGAVGVDENGAELVAALGAEGIDVSRVARRGDSHTGVAMISVGDDARNTIIVAPGANGMVAVEAVTAARDWISAADVLVMQLEVPLEVVTHAAFVARDLGTSVMLNAAPAVKLPAELFGAVDVLIVNESEAAALTGFDGVEPERLAAGLANVGPRTVVVTAGERGAWYVHDREVVHTPAFKVEAMDTVGAGDAFVGVFAARWAEHRIAGALDGMGVMDAMCWASAAGALATMRAGAIPSLPTREEIVRLLRTAGEE